MTTVNRRTLKAAGLALALAASAVISGAAQAQDGKGADPAPPPAEGRIHIDYEEPKNPALKEIYDLAKARHGLEMFRDLLSPFRLPEDLYVKTVECNGIPNAYFSRENDIPTIRFCYEYLKKIHDTLPADTTPEGVERQDALAGQLMFALMHEFGHAAFDIYNIPVFGRQEDAADQFATYVLLQFGGEKARHLIRGAAYSYYKFVKKLKDHPKVTFPVMAFSSDHGAPEERFFNLVCIAYGYDPQVFAAVVARKYLPDARARVCKYEYSNIRYAFHTAITPHIDMEKAREVLARSWFDAQVSAK